MVSDLPGARDKDGRNRDHGLSRLTTLAGATLSTAVSTGRLTATTTFRSQADPWLVRVILVRKVLVDATQSGALMATLRGRQLDACAGWAASTPSQAATKTLAAAAAREEEGDIALVTRDLGVRVRVGGGGGGGWGPWFESHRTFNVDVPPPPPRQESTAAAALAFTWPERGGEGRRRAWW